MNARDVVTFCACIASAVAGHLIGYQFGISAGVKRERERWVRFTSKLAPHVGKSIEDMFGRGGGGS